MTDPRSAPTSLPVVQRPATMKDVASAAGVSTKTVSRVLNGQSDVHPRTKARVEAAMKALNFRPNAMASVIRKRGGRTAFIGLVVDDLTNPFMAMLARAVQDGMLERKHRVLMGSSEGLLQRERELVAQFVTCRVDGLIIVPSGTDQSYLEKDRAQGIPVVFVDRPGRRIKADAVLSDNVNGVKRAVQHLAKYGHRRIGYIGDLSDFHTAAQRLEGYRQGMLSVTGRVDADCVRVNVHTVRDAELATQALLGLTPRPTALVCGNNLMTNGALHVLQAHGLRQRVAVIGFDDQDFADLLAPALTVITQDVVAMGRLASRTLFRRLEGESEPAGFQTVPVSLVERGSGELAADPAAVA